MAIINRKNKDGSITHQVKVRDPDGNWYPSQTFADRMEAEEHELDLKKKARSGEILTTADSKSTTVKEYWEVWSVENRSKNSESWRESQDQMWRDYIEPVIGHVVIAKVRPTHVLRVLNRMRDGSKMSDGQPRAESTIFLVYATLQKMFGDAVGFYEMLGKSPVLPKHHKPDVIQTESDFLPPTEAWKLLEVARKDLVIGAAVWLEILGGLRSEAALPLKFSDILWESSQAIVRRAWKRRSRKIEEYTKGGDWEYVPLVKPLLEYLLELRAQAPDPDGWICMSPRGGMLHYESYWKRLKVLCKKAGVREVSPHVLRHSASELFVNEGASQVDVQRLLHHKDPSTTARYMHRTDERLRSIAGRIARPDLRVVGGQDVPENVPVGEQSLVCSTGGRVEHAI